MMVATPIDTAAATPTTMSAGRLPIVLMPCYKPGYYEGQKGQPLYFVSHFATEEEDEVAFSITIKCSVRMVENFGCGTVRKQFVLTVTRTGDQPYRYESIYDTVRMRANGAPAKKRQWMTSIKLEEDKEYQLMVLSQEFKTWLQDAFEFYGFFV